MSQTGAITQAAGAGTINLASTAANSDIDLSGAANDFTGAVTFGGALGNIRDVGLRNINANAAFPTNLDSLTNLRSLTIAFNNSAVTLGAFTLAGDLNITAGGAITQTGALAIAGTSTFAAGSSNNITLNNVANDFASVGITSGNDVTLVDSNALALNASTISGALDVTTDGAITQTGALAIAGTSTFAAGSSNNITLNNVANDFASVGITSGNDVTLVDSNALALNASTILGNLNVTTSGALTIAGALNMNNTGNTATFTTNNNNITFDAGMNGAANLVLNAGIGDVTINANLGDTTRLGAITLTLKNLTSNATIRATTLTQSAGSGITQFNNGGLDTSGLATFATNTVNGNVNVGGMTINLSTGNMFGAIGGKTGTAAIQSMTVLNTLQPGKIYFDGIDIYTVFNPAPTPTPTPVPSNTGSSLAPFTVVFPTDFEIAPAVNVNADDQALGNLLYDKIGKDHNKTTNGSRVDGNCIQYSSDVRICM